MAKLKLPKTAKKRFKITGSGKILRRRCGHSHHLEKNFKEEGYSDKAKRGIQG